MKWRAHTVSREWGIRGVEINLRRSRSRNSDELASALPTSHLSNADRGGDAAAGAMGAKEVFERLVFHFFSGVKGETTMI